MKVHDKLFQIIVILILPGAIAANEINMKESVVERFLRGEEYAEFVQSTGWPEDVRVVLQSDGVDALIDEYSKLWLELTENDKGPHIEYANHQFLKTYQSIEKKIGRRLPAELIDWWQKELPVKVLDSGSVLGPVWGSISIITPDHMESMLSENELTYSTPTMGMAETMDYFHGSGEFVDTLSKEEYDTLNENYKIVGILNLNDSDRIYIYFDQNEQFGLIEYNHDWFHFDGPSWDAEYLTLVTKSAAVDSFSDVFADLLTLSIFIQWVYRD